MLEDFSKREQLKCSEIVGEALSLPKLTQRSGSLEWKLPKIFEFVGVANLATRAALPLAGGFEPPLQVRWKPGGWRCKTMITRHSMHRIRGSRGLCLFYLSQPCVHHFLQTHEDAQLGMKPG